MSNAIITIYTDNGNQVELVLNDHAQLEGMMEQLRSPRLFHQKSVIFYSEYQVANIQSQTIEMVKCQLPSDGPFQANLSKEFLVEISPERFEALYYGKSDEEKLIPRLAQPGDLMETFVEFHTEGGQVVFLHLNVHKQSPQEGRVFFTHLFEQPTLEFSLPEGGFAILRPAKITSFISFPGPGLDVLPKNVFVVA